jgi:2-polyprenyl-3-methyl-5-hydroxy-6-metoxy-1,4-benzoquinol methylase
MRDLKCNLCGSNKGSLFLVGREIYYDIDDTKFRYVKCKECGLVYQKPQMTEDELEKHYPDNYGPYQDDFKLLKYSFLSKFVKKSWNWVKNKFFSSKGTQNEKSIPNKKNKPKKRYLDFGCGSGVKLNKQRKKHPIWDLYGLDNNPTACKKTREKGFNVYCGTANDVDLPRNFFDEVYMGHVIEHLNDPKKVLKTISKSMKSGGLIEIDTPNVDSLAVKVFQSYWFALECPRHLFLFSPNTLSRMLNLAGFEVEEIRFDESPKVIIRSINYLFSESNRISFFLWHFLRLLLLPVTIILSKLGKTSVMKIVAKKK